MELECCWHEDAKVVMKVLADNGYAPKLEKKKKMMVSGDGDAWTRDFYCVTVGNKKA